MANARYEDLHQPNAGKGRGFLFTALAIVVLGGGGAGAYFGRDYFTRASAPAESGETTERAIPTSASEPVFEPEPTIGMADLEMYYDRGRVLGRYPIEHMDVTGLRPPHAGPARSPWIATHCVYNIIDTEEGYRDETGMPRLRVVRQDARFAGVAIAGSEDIAALDVPAGTCAPDMYFEVPPQ